MERNTLLLELDKLFIDDISEKIVDMVIFTPKTNEELQIAVDKWCDYKKGALKNYGIISGWDTSLITNMEDLFSDKLYFNDDISSWDVSNVTNMTNMFQNDNDLSDENQCAIHTSFSTNSNWPYDWSGSCPFKPTTKSELQTAVDLWVDDNVTALSTYGDINTWDVSLITDMANLFRDKKNNSCTISFQYSDLEQLEKITSAVKNNY